MKYEQAVNIKKVLEKNCVNYLNGVIKNDGIEYTQAYRALQYFNRWLIKHFKEEYSNDDTNKRKGLLDLKQSK